MARLIGRKSGKDGSGASSTASESPNTLNSLSTAKIIEVVSHGECVGLANATYPLRSVYFDNTVTQNSDGSNNYTGLAVDYRTGLPDQSPFVGFSDTETQYVVGTLITHATPIVYTITNDYIDAVRVTIAIQALTEQDVATGVLGGSTVSYTIASGLVSGGYTDIVTEVLNAKCTSQQLLSYRIERPAAATDTTDWRVRVTRNTADAVTVYVQNQISFDSTTEITDSNLQYADLGVVALQIDSQQFGSSIPNRSFDWVGMVLDVPSNYTPPDYNDAADPTKRVYTGLWDGTFKRAWCDNPAWILWALLTDKDWGLGNAITTDQIDKWALYQIAQYCDEFVDDGTGTSTDEPRYTINTQITSSQDAYAMLQTIASVFHGMTYWGTGTALFVADQPTDPVKIVNPTNVIKGVFTYQGAALKARHSVVEVTWNDPSDNYAQAVEVVEDATMIARFGWRSTRVTAFGCTSRGQAHRFGKWVLDTERYESEVVTYQASFDHIDVRPGQIISIFDPSYSGARMGGRINTVTGTSLTIDSPFTIAGATTYTVTITAPDGRLIERTLTNSTGATSVFTWSSTIAALPATSSTVTIKAVDSPAPVQKQQISAVTTTSVTFDQAVVLLNGVSYSITFTKPDGTTLVRPITTTITSGTRIATSNYYELLTLGWSSTLGATLPALGSTAFVAPSSEGSFTRTVSARTATTATVSSSFTFVAGYTYTATFTLPDGSSIVRTLTNSAGAATVLTWGGALDELPIVGAIWALTSTSLSPRDFRVVAIKEKEKNIFEVTAVNYDSGKYARIESNITLPPTVTSTFLSQAQPEPVTDLTASRNPVLQTDGTYADIIQIMWTPSTSTLANRYLVSFRKDNGSWIQLPDSVGTSAAFMSLGPGDYTFKVIAATFLNQQSVATNITLTLTDDRPFDGATITNIHLMV